MESKNITNNTEEKIEWCGWLNEFFWICAGVNREVLRQCPTDYAKYAGIGGTILFTAIMAALSGGYALNFVFDDTNIAIAFGVFWGLLIFNLDRFIVNTMYSDGKHTISWAELKSGLPRIIMAIFLGIVISTPLELKIFYKEIDAQMQKDMKSQVDEFVKEDKVLLDSLRMQRDRLREAPLDAHYVGSLGSTDLEVRNNMTTLEQLRQVEEELANRISNLSSQIRTLDASYNHSDSIKANNLRRNRAQLLAQLNSTKKQISQLEIDVRTKSKEYNAIMEKAEAQRDKDINILDTRIKELKEKVNTSETSYSERLKENFGGLRAQMKAFSELRREDRTTDIAAWFIMLLFIIIETAPTFFKMMIASGPYDDYLRAEMHKVRVTSDKRISDLNDIVNTEVLISTQKNKERLSAEVVANKELMERIAKVQAELLQTAIDKWRVEELDKIKQNPSRYIKSNSN